MKTALFYSIRNLYGTWSIVAVTSTKGLRHWYGRDTRDNIASHGALGDLKGRFDTVEDAQAKIDGVAAIRRKHAPLIKEASRALSDAHHAEDIEIAELLGIKSSMRKLVL